MKKTLEFLIAEKKQIALTALSLSLGLVRIFSRATFDLDPFIIFAFLLAAKASLVSMSSAFFIFSGAAFIRSLYFGVEIALVLALLTMLLCLPKMRRLHPYDVLPVALFFAVMSPFYLLPEFTFVSLQMVIECLIITVFLSLSIDIFTKKSKSEFDELALAFALALFPLAFDFSPLLQLVVIFASSLLYTCFKHRLTLKISFLFLLWVSLYSFVKLPLEQVVLILTPLIVAALLPKRLAKLLAFSAIALLPAILKNPTSFFATESFLAPLCAILIALCVDFNRWDKEEKSISTETGNLKKQIEDIAEYLLLIKTTVETPSLTKRSMEDNLRIKSCVTCAKKSTCSFVSNLAGNLPKVIYPPLKDSILHACPNGSKLVYRYRVVKDMVEYELRRQLQKKEEKEAMSSIIKPLEDLCSRKATPPLDALSLNNSLQVPQIAAIEKNGLTTFGVLDQEAQLSILKRSGIALKDDYHYDAFDQTYNYYFQPDSIATPVLDVFSRPLHQRGGDAYFEYRGLDSYEFFLLDAMGHEEKTEGYAQLALRLLNLSRRAQPAARPRLEEVNSVLRYSGQDENYVTLDLLKLDKKRGLAEVYKLGSSTTYLFHQNHLSRLENTSPPLGIVGELQLEPLVITMHDQDVLVFATDGCGELDEERLVESLATGASAREIFSALVDPEVEDDATIALLKISLLQYEHVLR